MGVFVRGNKLWLRFRDDNATWRNIASGYEVGQERLAKAMLEEIVREVKAAAGASARAGAARGPLTVRAYVERWLEERRVVGHDWKHDRARLEHALPVLGELAIADVRARHLIDAFQRIRTAPLDATGEPPAPRTVHRIYEVLSRMFGDAQLADLTESSPCVLDDRHLGQLVDKDPEWRAGALFTRDEATTLISSPVIPDDRKLLYAFMLLAGMRPGEASALRWRHYDRAVQPLGRITVALAYDSRRHREKSTKTDATRYVPVHPTLAAILAEWKLSGWSAMCGREPEPDDLILPLPPDAASARRTREGEPFRTEPYNGKRWREVDAPAIAKLAPEWRYRELYAMKATFITLVLDDGADPHVIESRVTHTKRSRSAFDGYNRGRQWEITCAEVAKLKLSRRDEIEAAEPVAVGDPAVAVTVLVTGAASTRKGSSKGLRRRVSNVAAPILHVVPCEQSAPVGAPRVSPSITEHHEAVTGSLPSERVSTALVAAADHWRVHRDARQLRRDLLALMHELDT